MDIATIIISALGGIFLWNMFMPKNTSNNKHETPPSNIDSWQVKCALIDTFGTTNIPAALALSKKYPDPKPDLWLVKAALIDSFGTTNLDFVFEKYLKDENREKFKEQFLQKH